MPRTLSDIAAQEIARRHGANLFLVFAWYANSQWRYMTDAERRLEVVSGTLFSTDPRVVSWGSLSMQIDPERVGGVSETQIILHDADGVVRTLVDASLQPSSSLFELSMHFIGPNVTTGVVEQSTWADRVVLHRGSVVAPSYSLATRTWTLKLRDLGAYYDKPIGFRVDRNNFADTRGTVSEGQILPIAFGDPVLRVPAVLLDRPGIGVLAEALYSNDTLLTMVDTAKTGAFETEIDFSPPTDPAKFFWIGVPGNFERIEGYVIGDTEVSREGSRQIAIVDRGWIVVRGEIESEMGSAPYQHIVLSSLDFTQANKNVSRNGHAIHFSTDNFNTYEYRFVTYWKVLLNGNVEVGYSGSFDYGQFDEYRIARYPGYIAEWPPGTPIYEEGDWTYCANAVPSTEVVRIEARAEIPSPSGGSPIKQHYTFADEYWSANLNDTSWSEELGRDVGADGITTVTLTRSPDAIGFTDKTVYVTLRGPQRSGSVAKYAPDILHVLMTHPALGNITTASHIDSTQLTAASTWLNTNRPVRLAFAVTQQAQLNELVGLIATNGTCGAIWDAGSLKCIPWPEWGDASVTSTSQSDSSDYPTEEIKAWSDIPTLFIARFKPYPTADEIKYVRRATDAEAVLGRREKEIELALIQRPSSIVLAMEFWFRWHLGNQGSVSQPGLFLEHYDDRLLDVCNATWSDGDGTSRLNITGPILEQSIKLHEPINGKPFVIDVTIPCRRRSFTFESISVDDIDIDPNCGDLPAIDPAYGWPNPNLSS